MRAIRAAACALTVVVVAAIPGRRVAAAQAPASRSAASQAPASQSAASQGDAGIREALKQYATALERLDADAVKKVQPSIEVENLRKAFREMRALNVTIEDIRILAVDATMARVSCKVNQTLTPKAGTKQTTAVTRVMRLRRQVGSWIIDSFER
jgi:hypothetical protein